MDIIRLNILTLLNQNTQDSDKSMTEYETFIKTLDMLNREINKVKEENKLELISLLIKEINSILTNYLDLIDKTTVKTTKIKTVQNKQNKQSINMIDISKGNNEYIKYEKLSNSEIQEIIIIILTILITYLKEVSIISDTLELLFLDFVYSLTAKQYNRSFYFVDENVKEMVLKVIYLLYSKGLFNKNSNNSQIIIDRKAKEELSIKFLSKLMLKQSPENKIFIYTYFQFINEDKENAVFTFKLKSSRSIYECYLELKEDNK